MLEICPKERALENVVPNMATILFWPKSDDKHDHVYAYYIIVANRNDEMH